MTCLTLILPLNEDQCFYERVTNCIEVARVLVSVKHSKGHVKKGSESWHTSPLALCGVDDTYILRYVVVTPDEFPCWIDMFSSIKKNLHSQKMWSVTLASFCCWMNMFLSIEEELTFSENVVRHPWQVSLAGSTCFCLSKKNVVVSTRSVPNQHAFFFLSEDSESGRIGSDCLV